MAKQISKTTSNSNKKSPPTPKSPTASPSAAAPSPAAGPKKFISRREAEAAREAAYLAEQSRLEAERAARAATKRRREDEAADEAKAREEKRRRLAEESRLRREQREAEEERARRKRLGLPELPPPGAGEEGDGAGDEDDEDGGDVPEEELVEKLRGMGEPVALFGESHAARLRRFRRLTGPVMDTTGPIATTLVSVEEKDMKVPDTVPKVADKAGRKWLYRQLASYFNMVLREWEIALAKEGNRDTSAAKAAVNAMLSSKETMKPVRSSPLIHPPFLFPSTSFARLANLYPHAALPQIRERHAR